MRCFIALVLPESARASLARAAAVCREAISISFVTPRQGHPEPRISWSASHGYHLTLAFLGDIEARAVEIAAAALDAAADFGPIPCSFAALGRFPARGRWRVLFAKLDDEGRSAALRRLVNERLAESSRLAGLPPLNPDWPGGKPFVPHVTLARAKSGPLSASGSPPGTELALGELAGTWTIGRCALYKSELRRSGAVYTELRAVDLS